jgi:hypothetical protein
MDAPTVSAFAAATAAVVAATVAGIQLFVGRKQAEAALVSAKAALKNAQSAGRHTVAEFRQTWINKVIDTLCEHHAITTTRPVGETLIAADMRTLAAARTKLGILLNPDETDTMALLKKIDEIVDSPTPEQRDQNSDEMLALARRLLKKEWVRIKVELL